MESGVQMKANLKNELQNLQSILIIIYRPKQLIDNNFNPKKL